jgi:lambda family phage portal protein
MANLLDRVISYFNPRAGAKRVQYRKAQQFLENFGTRRYEGAAKGRRTSGWIASSTGPNSEIAGALTTLRNRSRDLVRNNPYAARAIQAISANVVGPGIIPQIAPKDKKLSEIWNNWGDTSACSSDGMLNFYGIQNQVMREIAEAGEVLIRRQILRSNNGSVPLTLQVLEADHIDNSRNESLSVGGGQVINGIEFDARGRRAAYWLFQEHPGEYNVTSLKRQSVRVPAQDILHIFRSDRAGQIRGVPWGAPIILKLRDFDDYEDAQLLRQKIAACFAVFVSDNEAQPETGDTDQAIDERVEPGLIHVLPPGKKIEFGNPPTVGADYEPFAKVSLRAVATGFGVTYEVLTQDYSNVNFSSGRMGWIEFQRNLNQWRWIMLIPGLCEPVWRWFVEAAQLAGMIRYDRQPQKAGWTPPKREMIDPTKETEADKEAVRSGFKTLSEVIREQGNDPDAHFTELNADNEKIDKYRLKLDSDPRTMNSSGAFQNSAFNGGVQENEAPDQSKTDS